MIRKLPSCYALYSRSCFRNPAFTLIELLIVIAIISILAALLFPIFARARESARAALCLSNMKQVGSAITLYVQDWDETFPMNRLPDQTHTMQGCTQSGTFPMGGLEKSRLDWRRVVQPYLKNVQVLRCPSNAWADRSMTAEAPPGDETNSYYASKDHLPLSYAYNGAFFHEAVPACWYDEDWERPRRLPEISASANLILLLESRLPFPDLGDWSFPWRVEGDEGAIQSHSGLSNFLFADSHVKRLTIGATCEAAMWTDNFPDESEGCEDLSGLADEYQ